MIGLFVKAAVTAALFLTQSYVGIQPQVEQQTGVVNPYPTSCAWDVDDILRWSGVGILAPGESVSQSICVIADTETHSLYALVSARTNGLDVTVDFQPQARTFALSSQPLQHGYEWRGCVQGPDYSAFSPYLQPIPGSNGGVGVPTTVTWTISNPTGRTVRNIVAEVGVEGNYLRDHCRLPLVHEFGDPSWDIGV